MTPQQQQETQKQQNTTARRRKVYWVLSPRPVMYFYFIDRDAEPDKQLYRMNSPVLNRVLTRSELADRYGAPFFTHNPTKTTYHVNAIFTEPEQGNAIPGIFIGMVLGLMSFFGNPIGTCCMAIIGMLIGFYHDYINRSASNRFNMDIVKAHLENVDQYTMKVKSETVFNNVTEKGTGVSNDKK